MAPTNQYFDICVVGAGMAGLYFSWRMKNAGASSTIVNLEKLNRSGGRLDSDVVYINGEPVKNEEGGMRFTDGMKHLWWLIQTLGRGNDILPFGMGNDNNIYNLRGTKFTFGQANANAGIWSTIYNLAPNEKNKQPNQILQDVVQYILNQNGISQFQETPEQWQSFRLNAQYRGQPLYQWGFWALLKDYGLSQECMQMVEDCMGFLAFYRQEVNAGVGFQTMGDFDKLPQYKTLKPGYETLATTLCNQAINMGVQFFFGCTAVVVWVNKDNSITVQYVDNNAPGPGNQINFINCQSLVLAMPSLPLLRLTHNSTVLRENGQFLQTIQSVTSMPLTKVNLYFTERWWYTRYNIANGGSFTDLPMAQFYCYDQQLFSNQSGPASMTIYCDYDRTGYWDTLQQIGTPYPPSNGLTQPANTTAASTFVVEQAMLQLATFFGDNNLPQPLLSTYAGWGSENWFPFQDGDHSWAVGAKDDEIMAYLMNPIPNVYVCGEAFSDDQAWVNGALRSTELVLQNGFGIPPPF